MIDWGLYCYNVIPSGQKNTGATYQRLLNKTFEPLFGKTVEVFVGDMIVKSIQDVEHDRDLRGTFEILQRYDMKLNPKKCAFAV